MDASPRDGGRLGLALEALPLGVFLALAAFIVERQGGSSSTVWYGIALLALAFALTIAIAAGRRPGELQRVTVAGIACLSAFTAWGFATIAWAAVRGDAWDGANLTLLYLVVFALLSSWSISAHAVWPLLIGLAFAVSVEGFVTLEQLVRTRDPASFMIGRRLSEPLGYPNALAALCLTMVLLMVGLASRSWLPAPARALALALALANGTLNLLTESRGSAFTLPLVLLAFLALVPRRLRSLFVIGLFALAFAPVVRPVLDVYNASPEGFSAALQHAVYVTLFWSAVLGVVGFVYARVDTRLRIGSSVIRRTGIGVVAALVIALVAASLLLSPLQHVRSAWHSFEREGEPVGQSSHFTGGLGSNRYDFWRVGLIEFADHPIQGIGVNNFLVPYLQKRHSDEQPLYPHSLAIRVLSQTGLVGAVFFVGFLAFAVATAVRIPPGRERELAGVLVAGASVWLLHGLVDWLWEMPVLGVLGMALLGAAGGLGPRRPPSAVRLPRRLRLTVTACCGVVALVATASLAFPWLASLEVQQAASGWPQDPAAAISRIDTARRLNPLSDQADLIGGAIASRLRRYTLMQTRFESAVSRSPDDWYANFELGIAASLTGSRRLAATSLKRAAELDPGEPIVQEVSRTFRAGRRIDPAVVDRAFLKESVASGR